MNLRTAFPAVDAQGQYHARLAELRGRAVSGVYAIIDAITGAVCYIGESHTGRLYDTITRHFRRWATPKNDPSGRREGGVQYDREDVKIAFETMRADEAQDAQFRAIKAHNPTDNELTGVTIPNPPVNGQARKGSRTKPASGRSRGPTRARRMRPSQSSRQILQPNPGPGPLQPGKRVRVAEIVYEVDGVKFQHKFKRGGKGAIRLPKSAIKNGWIDE